MIPNSMRSSSWRKRSIVLQRANDRGEESCLRAHKSELELHTLDTLRGACNKPRTRATQAGGKL